MPVDKLCGSAQDLSDAEFVIECWDYDAISEDDRNELIELLLSASGRCSTFAAMLDEQAALGDDEGAQSGLHLLGQAVAVERILLRGPQGLRARRAVCCARVHTVKHG